MEGTSKATSRSVLGALRCPEFAKSTDRGLVNGEFATLVEQVGEEMH